MPRQAPRLVLDPYELIDLRRLARALDEEPARLTPATQPRTPFADARVSR